MTMIPTQRRIFFLFVITCISAKGYDVHAQQTHRYTLASNQPPALVADAGEDILLTSNETVTLGGDPAASGGTAPYSYSWEPSGTLSDPEHANPEVTASQPEATYTLTVTDAEGCTAVDEATLFVDITTSLTGAKGETPFAIYPNPARNWLTIRTGEINGTLTLLDSQGKQVLKTSMMPQEHHLDTRALSKGVYLLKIDASKAVYAIRIFIR